MTFFLCLSAAALLACLAVSVLQELGQLRRERLPSWLDYHAPVRPIDAAALGEITFVRIDIPAGSLFPLWDDEEIGRRPGGVLTIMPRAPR